jgi:hypothetical protein
VGYRGYLSRVQGSVEREGELRKGGASKHFYLLALKQCSACGIGGRRRGWGVGGEVGEGKHNLVRSCRKRNGNWRNKGIVEIWEFSSGRQTAQRGQIRVMKEAGDRPEGDWREDEGGTARDAETCWERG